MLTGQVIKPAQLLKGKKEFYIKQISVFLYYGAFLQMQGHNGLQFHYVLNQVF